MDETFLAGSDLDERADRDDSGYSAVVDFTGNRLKDDALDDLLSGVSGIRVDGGDEDISGLLDVDLRAGVGGDLLVTFPPVP